VKLKRGILRDYTIWQVLSNGLLNTGKDNFLKTFSIMFPKESILTMFIAFLARLALCIAFSILIFTIFISTTMSNWYVITLIFFLGITFVNIFLALVIHLNQRSTFFINFDKKETKNA